MGYILNRYASYQYICR